MGKKSKINQERLDRYYYLAKEQGYRSRASFKLIQLNKKYDFLKDSKNVLDLCAAPGGWLQVARKYMPMTGIVLGVDLASIKKIPMVQTIVGDITTSKTAKEIKQVFQGQKLDCVLHDGSPNVGSNWLKDAYTQSDLVLHSLKLSTELLKPKGMFITKVFRSKDYNSLLWVLNQFFEKVEATKPSASRHTSAEIYVVCRNYKAPKEIDPKLFEPNFVFEEISKKKNVSFGYRKKERNREGYEDENYILFKKITANDFVNCDNPVTVISEFGQIVFDEDDKSKEYLGHSETTDEIKILCSDTQVLGRYDFRVLLKWRQRMIQFRDEVEDEGMNDEVKEDEELEVDDVTQKKEEGEEEVGEAEDVESEDEQEKMKNELETLKKKSTKVKKNLKKREKDKMARRMPSAYNLAQRKTDVYDDGGDELFELKKIKSKGVLEMVKSGQIEKIENEKEEEETEDVLSKDEYEKQMEKAYDEMYDEYLNNKPKNRGVLLNEREKKRKDKHDLNKLLKGVDEVEHEEEESNPLVANDKSSTHKSKLWYSQNIFSVLKEDEENEGDENSKKKRTSEEIDESSFEKKKAKDFEEVPQEVHDEETGATTLALAKNLLRKKERRDFIDNAYNRFAFNDDDLPKWFTDDEIKNQFKRLPVTKEEIDEQSKKYEAINKKTVKKELEAKFREKKRKAKKIKQVKDKANQVADNVELTNKEKAKELTKLYKSVGKKSKDKVYVVSKKGKSKFGVKRKRGAVVKYVDPRMKTDGRNAKKRKTK